MTRDILTKEKERDEVISSAYSAVGHILAMKDDGKRSRIKIEKKLLTIMLWIITEADGLTADQRTNYKYKLTYRSEDTMKKIGRLGEEGENSPNYIKDLRHEHVYTRNGLINRLLKSPQNMSSILKDAIGCVVSKEEDKRLREVDKIRETDKSKKFEGWNRYKKAKIGVWNTRTNEWKIDPKHFM